MTCEPGQLRDRRLARAAAAKDRAEPLSPAQRDALFNCEPALCALRPSECHAVLDDWRYWARPTQLAPEGQKWVIWLILAGRGWGKTRTGAEWVKERIESGEGKSIGLIGPTLADVWDQMVFGTDDAPGLVKLFDHLPPKQRPWVNRNDKKIYFYNADGSVRAVAKIFTAEEPEVRGPNIDTWWCDELAKWPKLETCWANIEMTLRAKGRTPPRVCVTTTPRPLGLIKDLLDDPAVRFTFGSTFANAANLASSFLARILKKYAGSRLGLQELFGILLGDNPDALWRMSAIEVHRWTDPIPPTLRRVVVAVDPAISATRRSDLTGIIVLGIGFDDHLYVLADLTGVELLQVEGAPRALDYFRPPPDEPHKQGPEEWGELVVKAAWHYQADAVVCERNRGGDLVAANVRASIRQLGGPHATIKIQEVLATRGKVTRAEPVATLYEQGRAHHVGHLAELEKEQTEWNPKLSPVSPNRIDALVWGAYAVVDDLTGDPPADTTGALEGVIQANNRMAVGDGWRRTEDYDHL